MVTQKNNVVLGDQAGGDIDKSVTNNFAAPSKTPEMMLRFIEEFKRDYHNNTTVTTIIEELEHYKSTVDGEMEIQGLEAKLKAGGFDDYIPYAQGLKESFFKKLMKYEHYESAQNIYVFVLADVFVRFLNSVRPHILKNDPHDIIFQAVSDKVIDPLTERLGENVLKLYANEINGALYFLTGNCHIKWV